MEDYRRHIDSHGPNRRTWRFGRHGDLDADILNVRNVATVPILFADTIQTSAMKSSILHSDSVEITADLTVSTVSGIDQSFSTADIARITAIDIVTSNAQIEKRASCNDYAYRRNILSKRQTSPPHRPSLYRTESFLTTRSFQIQLQYSRIERCRYTVCHDSKSIYDEPRCNKRKIHTLDSTDMKTSSFHTNTIDASGTIDAHIVRVSNTIDTLPPSTTRDYFELSVLDADVHRINVTDGATFIGPVESVNIPDRLDVGKRWNIYDTCHGFGVGV
jgi:hypothetical protein